MRMWKANESEWKPHFLCMVLVFLFRNCSENCTTNMNEIRSTGKIQCHTIKTCIACIFAWTLYEHIQPKYNARFHLYIRFYCSFGLHFWNTNWIRVKSISLSTEGTHKHIHAHVVTSCLGFLCGAQQFACRRSMKKWEFLIAPNNHNHNWMMGAEHVKWKKIRQKLNPLNGKYMNNNELTVTVIIEQTLNVCCTETCD